MKSIIPNSLTLSNLFCGCLALLAIFSGQIEWVPVFWIIALLADYLDGFVARMLKVSSDLGKELDSLADMVSFGVVPGALFFYMLNESWQIGTIDFNKMSTLWGCIGFLVTLFSCLRLAKFNLDDRQADTFIGLNTPSCTTLVLGMALIAERNTYGLAEYILQPALLIVFILILSYLLISEVPMFSFKFKNLKWKDNRFRFTFMLLVLAILFIFPFEVALFTIILSYIAFSLMLWALGYMKKPERRKFF